MTDSVLTSAVSGVAQALLEVLFPTKCAGCDLPGELLCAKCREALPRIDPATACPHCFAPYGWLVCTECWDVDLGLDGAVAVGVLERPLSRCVTIYKDAHEKRLAGALAELLAAQVAQRWASPADRIGAPSGTADAIVPVPTSAAAIRKRGYDHTLLFARLVADALDIPCVSALEHIASADQRALSREERLANMVGAFALADPASSCVTQPPGCQGSPARDTLVPDRILLIDDVMTTGATLSAAAAVLRQGGAREVRAGFIARAW